MGNMTQQPGLPEQGRPRTQVMQALEAMAEADPDYRSHRLWSLTYWLDDVHEDFMAAAYQAFAPANGLNPAAFKSLKKMESEIVAAVGALHNGPAGEVCGIVTSGGTESCLLAVKTYRDMARAERRVDKPEMVLPTTAHVAWFKAAEYFDVKVRLLPLDVHLRGDVTKLPGLLNKRTILVVGSAPGYPHGTIDDIDAMASFAQLHAVPLHVDACVGGFILPFMAQNGRAVRAWDYRVPGVTSISADVHKYGYGAKGASTLTYRSMRYLRHQVFVHTEWPGGVFASAGLLGTRPGGAYAAAWAAMQHFGMDGYRELAEQAMQAFDTLKQGVEAIPELRVLGDPTGPLLAYGSRDAKVSIFAVGDFLDTKGWLVNRLQNPDGLHAMVTAGHRDVVDLFLRDLRHAVTAVKVDPSLAESGSAATYGMLSHVPLRGLVREKVLDLFTKMYAPGEAKPVDLHAPPAPAGKVDGLLEKLARWYVARKQQRG